MTASGTFHSEWGLMVSAGRKLTSLSTEALRGGSALLLPARSTWAAMMSTDARKRKQLSLSASGFTDEGGVGRGTTIGANLDTRMSDRLRLQLGPTFTSTSEPLQYVEHLDTAGTGSGYIVARLRQKVASITARADLAFSRRITLQLYAQPLVGSASYTGFAQVVSPRAASMDVRVRRLDSMAGTSDPSFGTRDVIANAVFRWEYRPGSALFVVFTQQRDAQLADPTWRLGQAARELWRVPASSVLMVKWSYWWAP
jgi:hypothetical protein